MTKSTDCSFKEPRFDSQNPQSSSESPITPVPGDLKSSFHGYQAYMWCTVTHTGKTPIHINTLSKGKRSEEGPAESILSLTPSERNHTSDHASAFRVCPFVPKAVPGCPELGLSQGSSLGSSEVWGCITMEMNFHSHLSCGSSTGSKAVLSTQVLPTSPSSDFRVIKYQRARGIPGTAIHTMGGTGTHGVLLQARQDPQSLFPDQRIICSPSLTFPICRVLTCDTAQVTFTSSHTP